MKNHPNLSIYPQGGLGLGTLCGNVGGVVYPSELTSTNLQAWYKDTYGLSGTEVQQWTDISGNARHLSQDGAFPTPNKVAGGGPNSRDCIRLTKASSEYLKTSGNISNLLSASAGYVYSIVYYHSLNTNNVNTWQNECVWSDYSAGNIGLHLKSGAGGQSVAYNWDGSDDNTPESSGTGTWRLITWKHASGNLAVRANNGVFINVPSGNTSTLANPLYLGIASGNVYGDFSIAELAFYNADISTDDSTNLLYFKGRYGLW